MTRGKSLFNFILLLVLSATVVPSAGAFEMTLAELAGVGKLDNKTYAKEEDKDSSSFGDYASIEEMADTSSDIGLGMVTGSPTGTYYRFGNEIKDAVQKDGIKIIVKESKGSIDNINRIDSRENAAFGIVQSDVLGFLTRSDSPKSKQAVKNLRMVFPFYQEEIHVVASKEIQKFEDLQGKTVAIGQSGSGSWLTAVNLFGITGVRPLKMLRLPPEEGLVAVLSGKAQAMIYVGGKPVKLFENLEELSKMETYAKITEGIHLVPMNDEKLYKEYSPTTITPVDYSFVKKPIPTIAVTSVLVSFNFGVTDGPYSEARCKEVKNFSNSLRKRLPELAQTGHPKWKEVDLDAEVGIWQRDACAVDEAASPSGELEMELLNIIKKGN